MNFIIDTFVDLYYSKKQSMVIKLGLLEWQYNRDNRKANKLLKKLKSKGLVSDDE